ncbi:MAG: hypothetical protein MUF19_01665 [Candidatus Pacebacteria bacterium]|jgi:hypothetical protein|nr:hypothetical protein [Candidatus Paceibacterota bacterium]
MQLSSNELPTTITEMLNVTKQLRCRLAWKALATGFQSHGEWHDLSEEEMLKTHVDSLNAEYLGELTHWIEYE